MRSSGPTPTRSTKHCSASSATRPRRADGTPDRRTRRGGGHSTFVPRSAEQSGRWLVIEVAGEGIAEAPAGGCEVVAGQGGGGGGRHDARGADQRPVGRVELGREHVEANAGEVPGIEVDEGGVGVEEAAAGDVDQPGARAHGSKHGVVDEGRLARLITGRDDDRVNVGDAVEEAGGGVDGGKGGGRAVWGVGGQRGGG